MIRHFRDDGVDTAGRPNQARQHLIRALEKTVKVQVDGGEVEVGVFRHDKALCGGDVPKMPYNPDKVRGHAECAARDKLHHSWPTQFRTDAVWHKALAVFLEERGAFERGVEEKLRAASVAQAAQSLQGLIESMNKDSAPRKSAKAAPVSA